MIETPDHPTDDELRATLSKWWQERIGEPLTERQYRAFKAAMVARLCLFVARDEETKTYRMSLRANRPQ